MNAQSIIISFREHNILIIFRILEESPTPLSRKIDSSCKSGEVKEVFNYSSC
jgi:hypothetical protein